MTSAIWKFKLDPCNETFIRSGYTFPAEQPQMPKDAKIVEVGLDGQGRLCLWAEVDTTKPLELRRFVVWATGFTFDRSQLTRIGSVQKDGHRMHVFEGNKPE